MSWEEMLDHLIEEVGAEAVLDEIVFAMSWRERYELWGEIADLIDLQFHYEDDEMLESGLTPWIEFENRLVKMDDGLECYLISTLYEPIVFNPDNY